MLITKKVIAGGVGFKLPDFTSLSYNCTITTTIRLIPAQKELSKIL